MSDYAILLYYDLLKLKNYGLEIRRNPKKLISYALFIAWIMLFLFPAIKNSGQRQFHVTADTAHIVLAVYALFTGFLMFSSFFSSLRKLSYSFQMGDVNLLFPSPLAPNRILLWSLIKRIPLDMVKTCLPAFCLTPAMINMGVTIEGIFPAYLSIFSFCLLLTPVSFLIFLVSTRYQKEHWVRGILLFSVGWLLFNWLQYVRADLFSLNVFLGYQAPGILNFPLFGWILQFARAAFFGAVPLTYTAIILVALTTLAANLLVYALARDYYEDILEPAERLNLLRKAKHSGKMQTKTGLWLRFLNRKRVIVERRYPGSRAFMFNQVVQYRRTSINEYVGYLAPLAVLTGLITGFIALYNGQSWNYGLLYAQNGILAYFLLISNSSGPLSKELALPYMYTLPGTFFQKAIAVNTLPTLRFGLNVFLLNLSYATIVYLPIQDAGIFLSAVLLSVLLTSFYWEQAHIIVLAHVLLPSSIDRKFFYPLIMFVELLLIGIPALIAGGLAVWLIQSTWFAIIAVIAVNMAMGIVLLFFSDKIFPLLEIREFVE